MTLLWLAGNKKRVLVSELSGRGNIVTKAQELGLMEPNEVVDDAWKGRSKAVLRKIKELESKGYTFEGAEASVELMIRRSLPGYTPPFELLDFTMFSSNKKVSRRREDVQVTRLFGGRRDLCLVSLTPSSSRAIY